MAVLQYLHRLFLGVWIGALLCFGGVLAPAMFRILGPADAGRVVREVIPVLDRAGLIGGLALLVLAVAFEGRPRGDAWFRTGVVGLMIGCAVISLSVVSPKMEALRHEAGDRISDLPKEHPTRAAFGKLHGVSAALMLSELILGLMALGIPLRKR